jgi:tetratricopeptide (TPR) repeat protein
VAPASAAESPSAPAVASASPAAPASVSASSAPTRAAGAGPRRPEVGPLPAADALRAGPPPGIPTGAPADGPAGPTYTLSTRPPDALLVAPNPVEACVECHPDEADHYAQTGMGRALFLPNQYPPIEDFRPEKAHVVHPVTGAVYRAYIDAEGRWWQEESMPGRPGARRVEALWVIGSGNHTRSYMGLVEGEVVELPLTFYARRRIWDMSPGYEGRGHFRFGRTVKPECLFCHNDLTPVIDGTLAGYRLPLALSISCDRCHGDGRAHAVLRLDGQGPPAGQADPSILNPGRFPPARQLEVCEQCHLQGDARQLLADRRWDAYDLTQPLADHLSIFVPAGPRGEAFSIASHGDRMLQSPCWQKSDGRLTCTTCHNPHKPATPASLRAACLSCHTVAQCGDAHAKAPDAECWPCHMRKGGTTDIPHVTFTDHWIRRTPGGEGASKSPPKTPAKTPPKTTDLVDALAPKRSASIGDRQAAVRLGLAHHDIWRFQGDAAHLPLASELLEGALVTVRDRPDAWHALARIREAQGHREGAAEAYATAVRLDPKNAVLRQDQAQNLEAMGDLPGAEAALRVSIAARPDYRVAWGNLANTLMRQQRMTEAMAAFDEAERLAPAEAITPQNRGFALLSARQFPAAEAALSEAARRDPLSPQPLFGLGMLAASQSKLADARPPLDAAVKLDPTFGPARFLRGQVRAASRDLAGAGEDFLAWVAAEPRNPTARLELAKVQAALGQTKAALATLDAGLAIAPGDPTLGALRRQLALSNGR